MKNSLLFTLFVILLGFSSCAEDAFESQTEFEALVNKSEVTVNVSYQMWTDGPSAMGCDGSGLSFILFEENAAVTIYRAGDGGVDDSGFLRDTRPTNRSGSITFTDLEPGEYTIIVRSEFGEQTQVIQTYKGKHKLVNFRF